MATDSAGHIHLLVGGHLSAEQVAPPFDGPPHGLYHLEWDGSNWFYPVPIYEGNWYSEYPHLVVDQGNQLHATWYIREELWGERTPHQSWYAHGQSQAPAETPAALPTLTPTPEPQDDTTLSLIVTPDVLSYPELNSETSGLPEGLYTESDEILRLVIAVSPVILVLLMVMGVKMGWFTKLRR
jgi:hypothetical protein